MLKVPLVSTKKHTAENRRNHKGRQQTIQLNIREGHWAGGDTEKQNDETGADVEKGDPRAL